MKLKEFLLHKTKVGELCVITDGGWIVGTCWIDAEDLFVISDKYVDREVKEHRWGELTVTTEHNGRAKVPCRYIEVV